MSFAAKLHWSPPEKRGQNRYKFAIGLTLHEADGTAIDVEVENLSLTGIGLRSRQELPIGSRAWLGIPGLGNHEIEIVRRDGDFYGCKLDAPPRSGSIGSSRGDPAVIVGRFGARPDTLLHNAVPPDVEVEKWPLPLRNAMLIGIPLTLWCVLIETWFLAR